MTKPPGARPSPGLSSFSWQICAEHTVYGAARRNPRSRKSLRVPRGTSGLHVDAGPRCSQGGGGHGGRNQRGPRREEDTWARHQQTPSTWAEGRWGGTCKAEVTSEQSRGTGLQCPAHGEESCASGGGAGPQPGEGLGGGDQTHS